MEDNTLYMFIDEGGNFDFSPRGTKYFNLTCLTEKRPFPSYDKLRNIKYDLIEDGINIEYFHATNDKKPQSTQRKTINVGKAEKTFNYGFTRIKHG